MTVSKFYKYFKRFEYKKIEEGISCDFVEKNREKGGILPSNFKNEYNKIFKLLYILYLL